MKRNNQIRERNQGENLSIFNKVVQDVENGNYRYAMIGSSLIYSNYYYDRNMSLFLSIIVCMSLLFKPMRLYGTI